MRIKFNSSVNSLAVSESSSRQNVKSILSLSNIKTICRMSNFKTQETAEMSKVFHLDRKSVVEGKSVFQVSKNAQNSSIVSRSWSRQILAHLINSIGDVWTSNCEIN